MMQVPVSRISVDQDVETMSLSRREFVGRIPIAECEVQVFFAIKISEVPFVLIDNGPRT